MIRMNDFIREYESIKPEIDGAYQRVMNSGWYILGHEVEEFEKEFASYIGKKYCIGVANGLEAIQIALMALGIGAGDEVITVSNSAVATGLGISFTGATPVFVDIDEYYHMDPVQVEAAITPKTKAIMPVHLFGQAANIEALQAIAKKHNIHYIEDACQAHGAKYKGQYAGSHGEISCFSFYPTKNLGTYGDGGALLTDDEQLYNQCKLYRNYGQKTRYDHLIKGLNSRLDEMHAAILRAKLGHLDGWVQNRRAIAAKYTEKLSKVTQLTLPKERSEGEHSYHLYVIQAPSRDELKQHMAERGVEGIIHYPVPIHQQTCYAEISVSLPKTEEAAKHLLSLPIHPFITDEEIDKVCESITSFYSNNSI
ncbi:DegT/DnrJ/EryC1/StrS family aminotransferase [Candidatus Woesebacteria bacterium]|nr:DegT/DnrJ/EryC1/StrS family aminotransferase [Candidatus Woesebacteria bacterium]